MPRDREPCCGKSPAYLAEDCMGSSGLGIFETCRPALTMSVHRGKTGSGWPMVQTTRLTHLGHWVAAVWGRLFALSNSPPRRKVLGLGIAQALSLGTHAAAQVHHASRRCG